MRIGWRASDAATSAVFASDIIAISKGAPDPGNADRGRGASFVKDVNVHQRQVFRTAFLPRVPSSHAYGFCRPRRNVPARCTTCKCVLVEVKRQLEATAYSRLQSPIYSEWFRR